MKTKIKICGIKRQEDINIVNKYKPDFIGFVFAESPRKISFNKALQLKSKLDKDIISVGVFVNAELNEILKLFKSDIISIAQLHGTEDEKFITDLKIKAFEETGRNLKIINAIEINDDFIDWYHLNISTSDYLLFDSGKGSGKTFNWNIINKNIEKPFFLAGGLNIENISSAINETNPFAIDLSSGSETDGVKDPLKIKLIINELKSINKE